MRMHLPPNGRCTACDPAGYVVVFAVDLFWGFFQRDGSLGPSHSGAALFADRATAKAVRRHLERICRGDGLWTSPVMDESEFRSRTDMWSAPRAPACTTTLDVK